MPKPWTLWPLIVQRVMTTSIFIKRMDLLTCKYFVNTWSIPTGILMIPLGVYSSAKYLQKLWQYLLSIVVILTSIEQILEKCKGYGRTLFWNWLLKLIFTGNLLKITSKLTSNVIILASITLAGEHIFQVSTRQS